MQELARRLLLIFILMPAVACSAEKDADAPADNYKPNDHYKVMPRPIETDAEAGQVQVLEFFLYTCPHCYAFEPTVHEWAKNPPAGVVFSRVPAAFGAHTVPSISPT